MNETISDSLSEDETDIYVNSVARLKALKKKYPPKPKQEPGSEYEEYEKGSDSSSVTQHAARNLQNFDVENDVYGQPDTDSCSPKCTSCDTFDRSHPRSCKEHLQQMVEKNEDSVVIDLDEDSDEIPVENEEDDNYEIDVKVHWRSQTVHRISMLRHDNFEKVFQFFASLEGVSVDHVLIMRKEMMVKRTDTPAFLNLSVIDILDGGIVSSAVIAQTELCTERKETQADVCNVKVQISSKQAIVVPVKRNEGFKGVMAMCAEHLNVKESSIKLYFDGERIGDTETPESLELEEEACIDLRLCPAQH